jgi:Na+-translocating ferredoxin:NAD+ oxidoreductase subunit C
MIKKPFFGLMKPRLTYSGVDDIGHDIQEIPPPDRLFLSLECKKEDMQDLTVSIGTEVRTGQRVRPFSTLDVYLTSPATGVISDITFETGAFDQSHLLFSIQAGQRDNWDAEFEQAGMTPDAENVLSFFSALPGISDLRSLIRGKNPLQTIVVSGLDTDLLVVTNQLSLKTGAEYLAQGIDCLEQITGVKKVIMAVPPSLRSEGEKGGVEVRVIEPAYPNAIPRLLIKRILGITAPASGHLKDLDVGVLGVQSVIALGQAFAEGKPPISRVLTVIDKENRPTGVRARIGTPVRHILDALHITPTEGDRLVFGGPMSGRGVYSAETPIGPDTDAILVQDKAMVIATSSDPCINCGECVRACPADLPVNMLIRLLENGLYEEAAQQYDLLSCIECGLCSYVCIMRIPISHYIMLGKHELALSGYLEESNG